MIESEKLIETIVKEILKQLPNIQTVGYTSLKTKKTISIVSPTNRDDLLTNVLPFLKEDYYLINIITSTLIEERSDHQEQFDEVILKEEWDFNQKHTDIVIFTDLSRAIIAKTALGISDTFETLWIEHCLATGKEIIMLTDGFVPFTGKEPQPYVATFEHYFETMSSFGIKLLEKKQLLPFFTTANQSDWEIDKKVITNEDILTVGEGGSLTVVSNAIVTLLAQETAKERSVKIHYKGINP
ncbi:MAG: hypothetical protein ACK4M9_20695 [Anaerobacillus sp.]|uniref:hypothetical protein n=1 Tax=Anaerobacillus sp. TaxID=1872506 RepID=UPI00391947F8